MSAFKSTILVHVNNLPYTQDGVVIYLTIDMFKFTDVTASYVYKTVQIIFPLYLQTITITLDVVKWR